MANSLSGGEIVAVWWIWVDQDLDMKYVVFICGILYCTVLYCTVLYCTVLVCVAGFAPLDAVTPTQVIYSASSVAERIL
jgi:hypothetical protein